MKTVQGLSQKEAEDYRRACLGMAFRFASSPSVVVSGGTSEEYAFALADKMLEYITTGERPQTRQTLPPDPDDPGHA